MKLLLDTHTLLWWWEQSPALSTQAHLAIADENNTVFISAVSMWELATKFRIGKLPSAELAITQYETLSTADNFIHLPLTWQHSRLSGTYAVNHADPFDRMLAAQSQIEGAALVTRDAAFAGFGTQTLW